jgi:tetratricopeptide (TPR) repeat protein
MSGLLRQAGKPPLPDVPPSLRDRTRDPADRVRSTVVYVRSMVPQVPGGVTLFALVPLEIANPAAYGGLAQGVVRHRMPFPWCAGVRFILRDDVAHPALATLASNPRTRSLRIDFSPEALAAALAREAEDETLPPERRMSAATVVAGIDQAHGRTEEALAHYEAALLHYGETGNAPMAALAANGIAACKQAQGDVVGAEQVMRAALEASLQANPPALPVMLNILRDLTMLVARQRRWEEAEAYLTATGDVASALFMPSVRAEALNRRGIAQMRLGKVAEAEQSWREAVKVADEAEERDQALAARTHLIGLLQQSGRAQDARDIGREIAESERGAHPAVPNGHGSHA